MVKQGKFWKEENKDLLIIRKLSNFNSTEVVFIIVGFVHNHPDRPFVMGGMFHGGTALGGGVNNHMRSIQTKSGIKVLMNDDEKSVTILDPSGNTYFMDGNGNIEVTAPNDITFTAGKNMNINVGENMTTTVGMNQSDSVGMNKSTSVTMNITETAGANIWQNATLDYSLNATNIMKIASENYTYDATDIHKNAAEGIEVAASKDYVQNSEQTVHNLSGEKGHNA